MKFLIAFDVSNNRRRTAVTKTCLASGFRVQRSVFEGFFDSGSIDGFVQKLSELIDPKTDSVRIYPLDKALDASIRILGLGKRVEEAPYRIV